MGKLDNSASARYGWKEVVEDANLNYLAKKSITSALRLDTSEEPTDCTVKQTGAGPYIPVTWGQACTYNNLCDLANTYNCNLACGNDRPYTGCVATTMSQLIRYWQPVNTYNYAIMPSDHGNDEVQKLMRDVGYAVSMDYGCESSSATGTAMRASLINSFGFSNATRTAYNNSYGQVLNSLHPANHSPVIFEGCGQKRNRFLGIIYTYSECHMWLCDGYKSTYAPPLCPYPIDITYYHMNWGWHETYQINDYNGWYLWYDWSIPDIDQKYQYAQYFTYNITP